MFKNTITPITKSQILSKRNDSDWDLYWKHIYNVLDAHDKKEAEIKAKKELAKQKTKR
jgi:hypothetical protein